MHKLNLLFASLLMSPCLYGSDQVGNAADLDQDPRRPRTNYMVEMNPVVDGVDFNHASAPNPTNPNNKSIFNRLLENKKLTILSIVLTATTTLTVIGILIYTYFFKDKHSIDGIREIEIDLAGPIQSALTGFTNKGQAAVFFEKVNEMFQITSDLDISNGCIVNDEYTKKASTAISLLSLLVNQTIFRQNNKVADCSFSGNVFSCSGVDSIPLAFSNAQNGALCPVANTVSSEIWRMTLNTVNALTRCLFQFNGIHSIVSDIGTLGLPALPTTTVPTPVPTTTVQTAIPTQATTTTPAQTPVPTIATSAPTQKPTTSAPTTNVPTTQSPPTPAPTQKPETPVPTIVPTPVPTPIPTPIPATPQPTPVPTPAPLIIPTGNCTYYKKYLAENAVARNLLSQIPCDAVYLSLSGVCNSDVITLAPALQQLTSLISLSLSASKRDGIDMCCPYFLGFDDGGAALLAPALERLTNLESLDLFHNYIGYNGLESLVPALQQLSNLKFLNLNSNPIGQNSVNIVISFLQKLVNLETLGLSAGIGNIGGKLLIPTLKELKKLKALILDVSGETCSNIITALPSVNVFCTSTLSNNDHRDSCRN